ncbi:hypothetical protein L7F22_049383 [Adiantum nelumboides]|nr:hypothetical protein [Adiantum nelumboides]
MGDFHVWAFSGKEFSRINEYSLILWQPFLKGFIWILQWQWQHHFNPMVHSCILLLCITQEAGRRKQHFSFQVVGSFAWKDQAGDLMGSFQVSTILYGRFCWLHFVSRGSAHLQGRL